MRHRLLLLAASFVVASCGTAGTREATPPTDTPVATEATTAATTELATTELATTETATTDTAPPTRSAVRDVAIASTDGRVAVLRGGTMSEASTGMIGADEHTLITTQIAGGSTTVTWTSLDSGAEVASTVLDGELRAVATDLTGRIVALTNTATATGTDVVVASADGAAEAGPQGAFRHHYDSELLPEGFADSFIGPLPTGMFVIEYLDPPPSDPTAPRQYRVRVLDLGSGAIGLPLNLRDKSQQVDEKMLGFSRTHVMSKQNGLLFTLYRGLEEDESQYAFVHTLGFVNGVYCLDLPPELWLERLPGAIAVADHETRLLVASANGYMTEFAITDIVDGSVAMPAARRTQHVWSSAPNADAPAMASTDDSVVVGQGSQLRWIDVTDLAVSAEATWDASIDALQIAGSNVVVAGDGRLAEVTAGGDETATTPLPDGFGTVARIVVIG